MKKLFATPLKYFDYLSAPLRPFLPALAVFIIGASILCCNLGARYLWQDEADTAVLALRMMSHGRPLAYDGRNLITMDLYFPEETRKLPTGDPAEAVQYYVRRGDFRSDIAWIGQPWGQFVVAGVFLALFGHDAFAARLHQKICLNGKLGSALGFPKGQE